MEIKQKNLAKDPYVRRIETLTSGSMVIKPNKWKQTAARKEFDNDFTEIVRVFKHLSEDKYLIYGMRSHSEAGVREAVIDAEIYEFAVVPEAVDNIVAKVASHCGIVLDGPLIPTV